MQTNTGTWNSPILTKQENAIAYDYCDDCLSDKEVADKRHISINTVQTHKKKIFEKYNINKITQLSKIYFTTFCMSVVLCIYEVVHANVGMDFIIESRRSTSCNTFRRSKRRLKNYSSENFVYDLPITA